MAAAPPPTFPFLKSQCQTASSGRFSRRIFKRTTASQRLPRSSVGAGYRFGVPLKSNAKTEIISLFFQCLWKAVKPLKTGPFQPHILGGANLEALNSGKSRSPGPAEEACFRPLYRAHRRNRASAATSSWRVWPRSAANLCAGSLAKVQICGQGRRTGEDVETPGGANFSQDIDIE